MKIAINILIICIVFILSSCAENSQMRKEVIALAGCDDTEIASDVLYSVKNLTGYFKTNNIELTILRDTDTCGYIIVFNSNEKVVKSAQTDVELVETCDEIFKNRK